MATVLLNDRGREREPRSSYGADELCGFKGMVLGISPDTSMASPWIFMTIRWAGSQLIGKILFFEQLFISFKKPTIST